ncbi:MAG: hypothetical protein HWD59_01370 [Coxiellaceae bacterium]|nr:MAG: hypothetical protein HWD59_01370 [Coxiellaceae bacterium]
MRGLSYYLKEELDLALKDYDKLAEIIGEERTVYHHNVIELRALLCIQQYNFEVALGYFTRLVKLDSDNAVALYWCAKINLIFGCNDIALCYFNKLLKCIDDHFDEEMSDNEYIIYFEAIRLHYKLYKLKLNVPDLMNLRERLERIVDINPEFASPYLYLAKVYIKMRNYQLGNDAFMQAIDKDPNFSQTHLTLARLFLN